MTPASTTTELPQPRTAQNRLSHWTQQRQLRRDLARRDRAAAAVRAAPDPNVHRRRARLVRGGWVQHGLFAHRMQRDELRATTGWNAFRNNGRPVAGACLVGRSRTPAAVWRRLNSDVATRQVPFLGIYLNDHLGGSTSGLELVRRTARAHADTAAGAPLRQLAGEIAEDRRTLVAIMRTLRVPVRHYKVLGGWAAEKAARLKPNGRLRQRSLSAPSWSSSRCCSASRASERAGGSCAGRPRWIDASIRLSLTT